MEQLLIATGNQGKLAEFRVLLGGLPYELVGLRDVGITFEVEEDGTSYAENACKKAVGYANASGLLTLADDSGIEVDALGREPGYLSARYGGSGLTDADRVDLLLRNLGDTPDEHRTGRFMCAIAITRPGETCQIVQRAVEGRITWKPSGDNGFGYDPIFFYPPFGKTFAEAAAAEKDAVSHRGQAAQAAREVLKLMATVGPGN